MDLRRSCATVYLPARGGGTRRLALPAWVAVLGCLAVPGAAALAVMLAVGAGPGWLAAGSPLARENAALRATMTDLDREMAGLADELAGLRGALADSFAARASAREHVPSLAPCEAGWTSSVFGPRLDPFTGRRAFHRGVDISLPAGSPVRATAAGTVVAVERQVGLGLVVKIDHGGGLQTVYAHLERSLVRPGQLVERGRRIARSGSSGRSSAPHLHYEVRRDGLAINPRPYLGEPAAQPPAWRLAAR